MFASKGEPASLFAVSTSNPDDPLPETLAEATVISSSHHQDLLDEMTASLLNNDSPLQHLIRWHLLRCQRFVAMHGSLSEPAADAIVRNSQDWAWQCNVLWLSHRGWLDPAGRCLLGRDGATEPNAQIPFPVEARQRQQQTAIKLANRLVDVPDGLWPVPASDEVHVLDAASVARRALALFAVAVRCESILQGRPISLEAMRARCPLAMAELTQIERSMFVPDAEIDFAVCEKLVWRYESLLALQWALGMHSELPWPDERCDLLPVSRLMIELPDDDIVSAATLRPTSQLLDAAELHFQAWHAVASAQVEGRESPAALEPGVIAERLTALWWILQTAIPVLQQPGRSPQDSWDVTDTWVDDGMPL